MNRRSFFRNASLAGVTAAALPLVTSCSSDDDRILYASELTYLPNTYLDAEILEVMENDFLKVSLFTDASMDILDKLNSRTWHIGAVALQEEGPIEEDHVWLRNERSMCEQFSGRFHGERVGDDATAPDRIRFTLFGSQNVRFGSFLCRFSLEEQWLRLRILQVDEEINSLVFPPPVVCDSLVLPIGIGKLLKGKERRGIYSRFAYSFFSRLNMRWIGGQKGDGAWMCIYEDGFEDALAMVGNYTASPGFTKTLDKWSHPFDLKYTFVEGNYVTLAKTYRNWFKEKGLFRTLKEKAAETPDLTQLYGGRGFWYNLAMGKYRDRDAEDFLLSEEQLSARGEGEDVHIYNTFSEARAICDHIETLGMKKGLFKIAGWINKGYDWSHPDVWPPEKKLGTLEEFQQLMNRDGKALMGLHDNYMDMYEGVPSWPKGVIHRKNGTYLRGGFWAGGQAYIMNYRDGLDYAKRNWEQIKTLNPKAMFVDTTTAMYLYQSYERGKEYTKADDHHYKSEMVKWFAEQGILFGSEEVADFAIPHIHWYETRHERVEGETIPLWPLVFHDAAILSTYKGSDRSDTYPKYMESMLYGYMMYFFVRNGGLDEELFKESLVADEWHEKIAEAEMVNHEFLSRDQKVERTTFSTGHSITCNFSGEDRMIEGDPLKAYSYRITTG